MFTEESKNLEIIGVKPLAFRGRQLGSPASLSNSANDREFRNSVNEDQTVLSLTKRLIISVPAQRNLGFSTFFTLDNLKAQQLN